MYYVPSKNRKSTKNLIPLRKKDIEVIWQTSFNKNGSCEQNFYCKPEGSFLRILNSCKIGFVLLQNQSLQHECI